MRTSAKEVGAMWNAEDRAVACVWDLPSREAAVTAVKVLKQQSDKWDDELLTRLARSEDGWVIYTTDDERAALEHLVEKYQDDPAWSTCNEAVICNQLRHLPTDQARVVAKRVARYFCAREGI